MVDLSVVGWVATGTGAFPALFLLIRITHYEDKIPDMIDKVDGWLEDIEKELHIEIDALAGQQGADRDFERVISIASNFSAIKRIQKDLDDAERQNSQRKNIDILAAVGIIGTALLYYGSSFPTLDATYHFSSWANFATFITSIFWIFSIITFYLTASQYSTLKRLVRKRQLNL